MKLGTILCKIGIHSFEIKEAPGDAEASKETQDAFGDEQISTVECKKCLHTEPIFKYTQHYPHTFIW